MCIVKTYVYIWLLLIIITVITTKCTVASFPTSSHSTSFYFCLLLLFLHVVYFILYIHQCIQYYTYICFIFLSDHFHLSFLFSFFFLLCYVASFLVKLPFILCVCLLILLHFDIVVVAVVVETTSLLFCLFSFLRIWFSN